MKCDEVLGMLEEYADESLAGREREHVAAHLSTCEECSTELAQLVKENALYSAFADRMDVDAPEWRDVRDAVLPAETHSAPWYTRFFSSLLTPAPMLGAATAAVLLITAAIGFMVIQDESAPAPQSASVTEPSSDPQSKTNEPPDDLVSGVPGSQNGGGDIQDTDDRNPGIQQERTEQPKKKRTSKPRRKKARPAEPNTGFPLEMVGASQVPALVAVAQAESTFEAAILQLRPEYETRKTALGAEASRRLDNTIEELDRAIAGTKSAVASNPNDPEAMQSLLAVYSQKVELLQNIASK